VESLAKVGLYGLSYKENVDDIRESPSLQLIKMLDDHLAFGAKSYDPFIKTKIIDGQYAGFPRIPG
jgi:UDP-N-acetyl-D-mannosaminuronic acid dehydrogenase